MCIGAFISLGGLCDGEWVLTLFAQNNDSYFTHPDHLPLIHMKPLSFPFFIIKFYLFSPTLFLARMHFLSVLSTTKCTTAPDPVNEMDYLVADHIAFC